MKHLPLPLAALALALPVPAAAAPAEGLEREVVWGILVVAVLQLLILAAQGWIILRAPRRSRIDAASNERPRLSVRRLSLEAFAAGETPRVQWNVSNIGEAPARIIESNASILIAKTGKLPAQPIYHEEVQRAGAIVQPGLFVPLVKYGAEPIAAWQVDAVRRSGDCSLYFFGYLLYSDNTGILRRTAFCRQFDVKSERFLVVDDPNYEQED